MRRLLAVLLILCPTWLAAGTCGNGYNFVHKFSVAPAKVPNTDQTSFPVTLTFNGAGIYNYYYLPDLKTVANGGQIQNTVTVLSNTAPADLIFCDAASAGNSLDYELVPGTYSATTGAGEYYVRIPTVSHTAATSFWMFYGNSSVSTSQQNVAGTWSNGYVSVFHGGTTSTLSLADALTTNTMTNSGTVAATGINGGGIGFSSTNTAQKTSPTGLPTSNNARTIEAWTFVTTAPSATNNSVFAGYGNLSACSNTATYLFASYNTYAGCSPNWFVEYSVCNDAVGFHAVETGGWHQIATALDAGNNNGQTRAYYDGVAQTVGTCHQGSTSNTINTGSPASLFVGNPAGVSLPAGNIVEEKRYSNVARSTDWIKTGYNTQSSPADFAIMFGLATGPRIVQYMTCNSAASAANTCTFLDNVVAGNMLLVIGDNMPSTNCTAPNINSLFTDTRGTTFTFASLGDNILGTGATTCIAFGILGSSGAEAITSAGFTRSQSMMIYEIAGVSSPSLDVSVSNTANAASSIGTGSATATTSSSILVCGFAGASSGAQFYTSSFSLSDAFLLNQISPPISGPNTLAGTGAIQFTGSGSKSCTFTVNNTPTRLAATLAVIKYTASSASKRRNSNMY
jgi:hypothetical protein